MCKYREYKMINPPPVTTISVYMEAGLQSLDKYIQGCEYCIWFPEELMREIKGLVEVLATAQRQGRTHGQLSLDHFILDSSRKIKLINFAPVWKSEDSDVSWEKTIDQIYLCPGHSQVKSDVYSLGICFLLIIYNGGEVQKDLIQNRNVECLIDQLQTYPDLQAALRLMLEPNETVRVDFLQLETYLQGGSIQTPPSVSPLSVSQVQEEQKAGPRKRLVVKRTCPKCSWKYESSICPKCTEVNPSSLPPEASSPSSSSKPQKPRFVLKKNPDIESEILIDGGREREICTCKMCGDKFSQKHIDSDPILNQQFKDFCSEDCLIKHVCSLDSNNEG
jgi:hypothetical protein